MPTVRSVLPTTNISQIGQRQGVLDATRYITHVKRKTIVFAANVSFAGSNEDATYLIRWKIVLHGESASTIDSWTLTVLGSTRPQMELLICMFHLKFETRSGYLINATLTATRADHQPPHPITTPQVSVMVLSGPGVLRDRRQCCNHRGAASHFSHQIGCRQDLSVALRPN